LLVSSLLVAAAQAQITQFKHIIIVFQENRTPDNLFYALCLPLSSGNCSTTDPTKYNIQTSNWLDKTSPTGFTQPTGVELANGYDLDHSHAGWKNECDLNAGTGQCRMDGAALTRINRGAFVFVNNTVDPKHLKGILAPYLELAAQYGWANDMFQTNEGPSFPAHQYIFGGTSALSKTDDTAGTFISENFSAGAAGCYAQNGETTKKINAAGQESTFTINYALGNEVCVKQTDRITMRDLLEGAGIGWKYYSTKGAGNDQGGSIWTAPNAIKSICVPDINNMNCTGTEWTDHVDLTPSDILSDLGAGGSACQVNGVDKLQGVSWVIPDGGNSDHPGGSKGGPDWVASIVNALGQSPCSDNVNGQTLTYWQDTAVVLTWDDWGGWYDHAPPTILPTPEGGYQLGFRVPMVFVSAYTPLHYINNKNHDFGTILRFIEHNFALGEGTLGFADNRGSLPLNDLGGFYNLSNTPRVFSPIPAAKTALDFINDKTPPTDPDDY
jgi:phospholipase C